jgi:hypothetical protein
MKKEIESSPQALRSTESESQIPPAESLELIAAEITNRASTTTHVLEEILAQDEDRRYTQHWGINE